MTLLARVHVSAVDRISPSFARLELAGADLADFGVAGPTYDQRFKLILPRADGTLPALVEATWWTDLAALPEAERAPVRTYTVREVRGEGADTRIVVDFVLHPGAHGPGSSWGGSARVGDVALAALPRRGEDWGGIEWAPGDAERLLLVGDETAVPAVAAILAQLPADARGSAYLEVPVEADVQPLAAPSGVRVTWLPRDGRAVGELAVATIAASGVGTPTPAPDLVPDATEELDGDLIWETPLHSASGEPLADDAAPPSVSLHGHYAWIAGESTMVRTLRRHLVDQVGLPRPQVAFMGYWRVGVAMRG